jgi:peroxiredoxin
MPSRVARHARQTIVKTSGRFAFVVLALFLSVVYFSGCSETATTSTVTQLTAPAKDEPPAAAKPVTRPHEVRKEVAPAEEAASTGAEPAGIPPVLFTSEHSAMCRVRVGDQLPAISLPKLSGGQGDLASLQGKKATVVLFWQNDPWMSQTALKDLSHDVAPSDDVSIVGIVVKEANADFDAALKESGAKFPQLVDNDGKAFNQVGMLKIPRVYVLDGAGKIVWFDIEYSQSTRRELRQTLEALTAAH